MTTNQETSTETADRYPFGYSSEISSSNVEANVSTAKRLRQRLQRQQSGQSGKLKKRNRNLWIFRALIPGRRYTGESSDCSSIVGTPTESGRCFTFTGARAITKPPPAGNDDRKPSMNQNLSELLLDVVHFFVKQIVKSTILGNSHRRCGNGRSHSALLL